MHENQVGAAALGFNGHQRKWAGGRADVCVPTSVTHSLPSQAAASAAGGPRLPHDLLQRAEGGSPPRLGTGFSIYHVLQMLHSPLISEGERNGQPKNAALAQGSF